MTRKQMLRSWIRSKLDGAKRDAAYEVFREWYDEEQKRTLPDLHNVTLENYMARAMYDRAIQEAISRTKWIDKLGDAAIELRQTIEANAHDDIGWADHHKIEDGVDDLIGLAVDARRYFGSRRPLWQ